VSCLGRTPGTFASIFFSTGSARFSDAAHGSNAATKLTAASSHSGHMPCWRCELGKTGQPGLFGAQRSVLARHPYSRFVEGPCRNTEAIRRSAVTGQNDRGGIGSCKRLHQTYGEVKTVPRTPRRRMAEGQGRFEWGCGCGPPVTTIGFLKDTMGGANHRSGGADIDPARGVGGVPPIISDRRPPRVREEKHRSAASADVIRGPGQFSVRPGDFRLTKCAVWICGEEDSSRGRWLEGYRTNVRARAAWFVWSQSWVRGGPCANQIR